MTSSVPCSNARTHRPCHLMQRGVDTEQFSPTHRTRPLDDSTLVLGYVGRLSVEKNVALLIRIERELLALGITNFRFLIVGHGSEDAYLRASLTHADFPGVLRGAALAQAYADMDLFLFPSHTDTFGNVVLEALSSGVPAIVTPGGGPKYIVHDRERHLQYEETGFITPDDGFSNAIATLASDRARLAKMRIASRAYALTCSCDAAFRPRLRWLRKRLYSRRLVTSAYAVFGTHPQGPRPSSQSKTAADPHPCQRERTPTLQLPPHRSS